MPARRLRCIYCEYEILTFLTDEELEKAKTPCPKCGCPHMEIAGQRP